MAKLVIKSKSQCMWDLLSLGEVMLRLDPGDERISTTRHFRAWEGGGEYNVARGLRRCFGMDTAIVTALAEVRALDSLRRSRPHRSQRAEFYRTRLWNPSSSRLFRSWSYRNLSTEARRNRLAA